MNQLNESRRRTRPPAHLQTQKQPRASQRPYSSRQSYQSSRQARPSSSSRRASSSRQDYQSYQPYQYTLTEEERAARRSGRAEARRLRRRAQRIRKWRRNFPFAVLTLALVLSLTGSFLLFRAVWRNITGPADAEVSSGQDSSIPPAGDAAEPEPEPEPEPTVSGKDLFRATPSTVHLAGLDSASAPAQTPSGDGGAALDNSDGSGESGGAKPSGPSEDGSIRSAYAVLIDLDEGSILAEKDAWTVIHPASMTKILTLLVAAEQIEDCSGSVVVSPQTTAYCYEHNCSIVGFLPDEEVSVMDLFYGTILPSGADAAITLAEYAAGSQEDFVKLMNQKAEELGISETARFANCTGLYDENNVCTVYDMAIILKAAMENDFCRQILGQRIYDIPVSDLHPEGISLSNWFIRRIEDHMPQGVTVKGAKTGFITQSGNCAASLAQDASGHSCICVTAMAGSAWQCIFDHVTLYQTYGFPAAP